MLLRISILFWVVWISAGTQAQSPKNKLVKIKVNDFLQISLPEEFRVMDSQIYTRKYGAYRPPLAIYTSEDGNADFGVNESVNQSLKAFTQAKWNAQDLEIIKGIYKASIAAMHTEVSFIQDKVETIRGRSFAVLEFVGFVKDEDKTITFNNTPVKQYSYLMYTVHDGKILIFNFNCPAQIQNLWQETARQIMQNIILK
ncbi:MAG: hypothetical protein NW226_07545 [Microscillaceae bacterium]|nr:hypothetical protein [Microscillaceae bacterium]